MDSKVITFSNFKGGTGKTTNSTMTGIELARRGYK
ncbi:AAA family ATPase, partial [Levilactobacillus brevis]